MLHSLPSFRTGLLFVAVLLSACKDDDEAPPPAPLDRAVMVPVTAMRSRLVVQSTSKGMAFTEVDNSFTAKLGARVGEVPSISKSSPPVMMMAKAVPPLRNLFGHPEKSLNPATRFVAQTVGEENTTLSQELHDLGSDLDVFLRERLFVESNLETSDTTSATYLLRPDPTCRPLPSDGDPTMIDAECAADLMKLPVRIVMTGQRAANGGDGVKLSILIGEARAELIAFIVEENLIALEANLPSTKQAIDIVNTTFGTMDESAFSLQVQSGKLRMQLARLSEQSFRLSWHVLDTVALTMLDNMAMPVLSFSTEMRPGPVLALTGDGAAKSLEWANDFGKTTVKTAWDPQETGAANQDLVITLGGYSWTTTLSEAAQEMKMTNLGLGDETTQVAVRGTPIFQLDLNGDSGRRANLRVTLNATEQPRVEVSPELALRLLFNLKAVAAEFAAENQPDATLLDEVYSIVFAGALPTVFEVVPEDPVTGFGGGIRMNAGTLTLGSKAGAAVVVPTGQCLIGDDVTMGEHELLGAFKAGMCM